MRCSWTSAEPTSAGGETLDEFAVVGRCGADQCLELGASIVHLGCRQARAGGLWFVPAVGQPDPISQRSQHQLLPALGRLRVEWLWPESRCCGVDLVDGSVMCDPSDGVVPHGGSGPVGRPVAEPVREPLRSGQPAIGEPHVRTRRSLRAGSDRRRPARHRGKRAPLPIHVKPVRRRPRSAGVSSAASSVSAVGSG